MHGLLSLRLRHCDIFMVSLSGVTGDLEGASQLPAGTVPLDDGEVRLEFLLLIDECQTWGKGYFTQIMYFSVSHTQPHISLSIETLLKVN